MYKFKKNLFIYFLSGIFIFILKLKRFIVLYPVYFYLIIQDLILYAKFISVDFKISTKIMFLLILDSIM